MVIAIMVCRLLKKTIGKTDERIWFAYAMHILHVIIYLYTLIAYYPLCALPSKSIGVRYVATRANICSC
jgi:hypothetical protein